MDAPCHVSGWGEEGGSCRPAKSDPSHGCVCGGVVGPECPVVGVLDAHLWCGVGSQAELFPPGRVVARCVCLGWYPIAVWWVGSRGCVVWEFHCQW